MIYPNHQKFRLLRFYKIIKVQAVMFAKDVSPFLLKLLEENFVLEALPPLMTHMIPKANKDKGISSLMLFLDFHKAFDSLEHSFIFQVLAKFVFGDSTD